MEPNTSLEKYLDANLTHRYTNYTDFVIACRIFNTPTRWGKILCSLSERYKNENNQSKLLEVHNLVEEWMRLCPEDFSIRSLKVLKDVVKTQELSNKIKLQLLRVASPKRHKANHVESPIEPSKVPMKDMILSLPADVIAGTLSHLEHNLFKQVLPSELVDWYLFKDERENKVPHIVAIVDRFNKVSQWVCYNVLKTSDDKERIKMIEKFILVAKKLEQLGNFNGIMEIVSALNSMVLQRLHCWENLGDEASYDFQSLEQLLSSACNFSKYREQLSKRKPNAIPLFPIATRDITFSFEMPKYIDNMINWNLVNAVGYITREFKICQSKPMKFAVDPEFEKAVSCLPFVSEEELEKLSYQIQPSIFMDEANSIENADVETKSTSSGEVEVTTPQLQRTPSPPTPTEVSSPVMIPRPRRGSDLSASPSSSPSPIIRKSRSAKKCDSVKVPMKFERTFWQAEESLKRHFRRTSRLPFRGELKVAGQRHLAIRTDSLSNDFLKATQLLMKETEVDEVGIASFLYQIATLIGKFDAINFAACAKDDLNAKELLAAAFIAPAFLGLSRSTIHPDSVSEKFRFTYSHLCLNAQTSKQCLQCAWTSAYTTGWLSHVSNHNLKSQEVSCLSHGDKQCCSVIAPVAELSGQVSVYFQENPYLRKDACHKLAAMNALEEQRKNFEMTKPKKPKLKIPRISFGKDVNQVSQTPEELSASVNGIQKEVALQFFEEMKWDIKTGSIFFNKENYFLMNSTSLFVDLYNELKNMCTTEEKGVSFALSTLFEICEYMGAADCMFFSQKTKNFPQARQALLHKIAGIRTFLAQCGWGRLVFHLESFNTIPVTFTGDIEKDFKNTMISFEIQNCSEAECWKCKLGSTSPNPTCICSAGYVAGWLSCAFGTQFVLSEVTCASMDHEHCTFVAAIPSRIKSIVSDFASEKKLPGKPAVHLEKYLKHVMM